MKLAHKQSGTATVALYSNFMGVGCANDESQKRAPPHEQMVFIRLKQATYDKSS